MNSTTIRNFLNAGGRILIAPNGRAEPSIDGALIFGGDVPDPVAASRHEACRRFVCAFRHERGVRFAARAVRMLGASTENGWRVLAGGGMTMGKVIEFPREVTVEAKIRSAERLRDMALDDIENCSIDGETFRERYKSLTAPRMLEIAQEKLQVALVEREMLSASDLMQFRGVTYRACPSQNGGH